MRLRRTLLPCALAALLAAAGCARPAPEAPPKSIFLMRDSTQSWNANPTDTLSQVEVTVRYPEFRMVRGGQPAIDSLDTYVRGALLQPAGGGAPATSYFQLMADFVDGFRKLHRRVPSAPSGWFIHRTAEVLGDTLGVLSLAVSEQSYAGGVHPRVTLHCAVFDTRSGHRYALDELVRPAARDSLDRVGERALRQALALGDTTDLGRAGFGVPGARFHVNANFAVVREGLAFTFNDSEIGPEATGPTALVLSWAETRAYLRPDGPLGAMAATAPARR